MCVTIDRWQYTDTQPTIPSPPVTGPLEATGLCQPGDVLVAVNDHTLPGGGGLRADLARLRDPALTFPCRLAFLRPATATANAAAFEALIPTPPADGQWGAVFTREDAAAVEEGEGSGGRPVLRGFKRLPGPLARRGLGRTACRPGRVLRSINGTPLPEVLRCIRADLGGVVGSGPGSVGGEGEWEEVEARLRAALGETPLPASLVLRDMEAWAAMCRWIAPAPAPAP